MAHLQVVELLEERAMSNDFGDVIGRVRAVQHTQPDHDTSRVHDDEQVARAGVANDAIRVGRCLSDKPQDGSLSIANGLRAAAGGWRVERGGIGEEVAHTIHSQNNGPGWWLSQQQDDADQQCNAEEAHSKALQRGL